MAYFAASYWGAKYWAATYWARAGGVVPPTPTPAAQPAVTYGHGEDYEVRVRNWWAQIERLRAESEAQRDAERERTRYAEQLEAERRALESQRIAKRAKKAKAQRDAELGRIGREIDATGRQSALLRAAIAETFAEIGRIHSDIAAAEAARVLTARRQRMALALLLIAANQ